jgi:uncharacterized membrane protein YdjX (TVP38/TMEM64 family)
VIRRTDGLAWITATAILAASTVGLYVLIRDDGRLLVEMLGLLEARIAAAPLQAMVAFVVLMAVTTCLTLPTATVLCLSGGYLFGAVPGALLSWIGATIGAVLTVLMIRFIAGERVREFFLRGRARRLIELLERDAFFYLMMLRIVPIAPFFAINAAGATIRIGLPRFTLATALGLLPILTVYAGVGAGVETLVEAHRIDPAAVLAQPRVLLPLLGLLALLCFGWAMRRWVQRRDGGAVETPR